MEKPKVIFLDAVFTLFGVKGSVGDVYSDIARQFGVNVEAEIVDQAFRKSFQCANPLAFPGVSQEKIPVLEYNWWQAIAQSTFREAGVLEEFRNFKGFFSKLYTHFATPQPWFVYPDVLVALQTWQSEGIELGIISNFDTRIYPVLEALELKHFFKTITISSEVGVAKPRKKIFAIALKKHNCLPQEAWHIGDSLKDDYYGAKALGIKPFLLER